MKPTRRHAKLQSRFARAVSEWDEIGIMSCISKNSSAAVHLAQSEAGMYALVVAARVGRVAIIRRLIALGTPVNVENSTTGFSPLQHAAMNGELKSMEVILDEGEANINLQTYEKATALHLATMIGRTDALMLLLARGARVNIKNEFGHTAHHFAIINGNVPLLRILLNERGSVDRDSGHGLSLLNCSARHPDVEVLRLLISHYPHAIQKTADISNLIELAILSRCGRRYAEALIDIAVGLTGKGRLVNCDLAFYFAAHSSNRHYVDVLLLALGRRVIDIKHYIRSLSVTAAIENGNFKTVRDVARYGLELNDFAVQSLTHLTDAVRAGKSSIVRMLLAFGAVADPTDPCQEFTEFPFLHAVSSGNFRMARLLLKNGADVENSCSSRRPFAEAAIHGQKDMMQFLVTSGANPHSVNADGSNALIAMVRYCNDFGQERKVKVMESLMSEYGLDIASRTKKSKTALHIAAKRGLVKAVNILVRHGADVNARLEDGKKISIMRYSCLNILVKFTTVGALFC